MIQDIKGPAGITAVIKFFYNEKGIKMRNLSVLLIFVCIISLPFSAFSQQTTDSKSDIYAKIKCCNCAVSFGICTCPEAKEMKADIDALLESKRSKDDIFYEIARKYSLNTMLDPDIRQRVEKRLLKEFGDKRPQIVIDPQNLDFGRVSKKQNKVSSVFKIQNKGNLELLITNIKASCSCVEISLINNNNKSPNFGTSGAPLGWQSGIKPGEAAELEVTLDLNHPSVHVGELIREVSLTSNDRLYPQISLMVTAEVTD